MRTLTRERPSRMRPATVKAQGHLAGTHSVDHTYDGDAELWAYGQKRTTRICCTKSASHNKPTFSIRCWRDVIPCYACKNSLFRSQGIRPKKSDVSGGLCRRGGAFQPKFPVFFRISGVSSMMLIGDEPQSYPSYRDIAGSAASGVKTSAKTSAGGRAAGRPSDEWRSCSGARCVAVSWRRERRSPAWP